MRPYVPSGRNGGAVRGARSRRQLAERDSSARELVEPDVDRAGAVVEPEDSHVRRAEHEANSRAPSQLLAADPHVEGALRVVRVIPVAQDRAALVVRARREEDGRRTRSRGVRNGQLTEVTPLWIAMVLMVRAAAAVVNATAVSTAAIVTRTVRVPDLPLTVLLLTSANAVPTPAVEPLGPRVDDGGCDWCCLTPRLRSTR